MTTHDLQILTRQVRLVTLLNAAERAGITPLRVMRLHTLAFLSNVLAPVWDLPVLNGDILKRQGGPFYPTLQDDLDRLVGIGVVSVNDPSHVEDDLGRWRLEGSYSLNHHFAEPIVNAIGKFPEEMQFFSFATELSLALSTLTELEFDEAMKEDVTYSAPVVSFGNVLDFSDSLHSNLSYLATEELDVRMANVVRLTPGEKVHFYIRYLHARLQSA